jgi:hypothetical protein
MLLGYKRIKNVAWTISSTGSTSNDAFFQNSTGFLLDGKLAIPTQIIWPTVGVVGGTHVIVRATPADASFFNESPYLVVAVGSPKDSQYAMPTGQIVSVFVHTLITSSASVFYGYASRLANGAALMIAPCDLSPWQSETITAVSVLFYNTDASGSAPYGNGSQMDVGEISMWNGAQYAIKNSVQDQLVDTSTQRRSHSNQPWRLFRNPYRQVQVAFSPMTDQRVYDLNTRYPQTPPQQPSYDQLEYVRRVLSTQDSVVCMPRVVRRGLRWPADAGPYPNFNAGLDLSACNQLSVFGQVDSFQAIQPEGDILWTAGLTVSETPP